MLYEQSVHLPVRKCSRPSCDYEAGVGVGAGVGAAASIIQYILQAGGATNLAACGSHW